MHGLNTVLNPQNPVTLFICQIKQQNIDGPTLEPAKSHYFIQKNDSKCRSENCDVLVRKPLHVPNTSLENRYDTSNQQEDVSTFVFTV